MYSSVSRAKFLAYFPWLGTPITPDIAGLYRPIGGTFPHTPPLAAFPNLHPLSAQCDTSPPLNRTAPTHLSLRKTLFQLLMRTASKPRHAFGPAGAFSFYSIPIGPAKTAANIAGHPTAYAPTTASATFGPTAPTPSPTDTLQQMRADAYINALMQVETAAFLETVDETRRSHRLFHGRRFAP